MRRFDGQIWRIIIVPFLLLGPAVCQAGNSSPIALTSDDRFVWVVNPDNNSVSVIEVRNDVNQRIAEIPVGQDPQTLAVTGDNKKVYVTNRRSGTVSVIDAASMQVVKTIDVGTEPFGCALTPEGRKLYVANHSSGDVSVINTHADIVIKTIQDVGPKPAAIAVTADKVYVTLLLAQLRSDDRLVTEKEGRDDGKEGRVTVISSRKDRVIGTVVLNPLANTGFNANGSVLDRVGATDPATFTVPTAGFPNLLQSVVLHGDRAYLPNVGASPNGPVRFNVNVQAFLSVFDTTTDEDSGQTINMNRGIQFEPPGKRLFLTTPIAMAFKNSGDEGFVVAAGVDRLVRVVLDQNGTPTVNAPTNAADPGNVVRIELGIDPPGVTNNSNPQGISINSTDTRAYVMNFISRDVSVVDISGSPDNYHELARIPSASLPAPGTLAAIVHRGNELFNTSIGPEGTADNARRPAGRMSDFGWGDCYNCHPRGLTDGVTWMFGDGPRQTISMESTGEHPQPADARLNANGAPLLPSFKQRVLNWSAVRDEIQDIELNIRGVSGGQGLIRDGLAVVNLTPTANTGRDADLDALAAYVAMGIKAPISPRRGQQDVARGRELFAQANCQSCHGGPNWTRSRVDFTPPPGTNETITAGQLVRFLVNVGTFDATAANELRPAVTNIVTANGALGFNIPSLVSVFAGAPYLHSGAAPTLDDVLENATHRTAGTPGQDPLSNANDRSALVRFLESIDGDTPPFP
jgi:YVTN family beta-propeller protein